MLGKKAKAPCIGAGTIALSVAAIIARKVRLQHFKDTKKVNILSFIRGVSSGFLLLVTSADPGH